MFLEEIFIYNQDLPKTQKMTQRNNTVNKQQDMHVNENFTARNEFFFFF